MTTNEKEMQRLVDEKVTVVAEALSGLVLAIAHALAHELSVQVGPDARAGTAASALAEAATQRDALPDGLKAGADQSQIVGKDKAPKRGQSAATKVIKETRKPADQPVPDEGLPTPAALSAEGQEWDMGEGKPGYMPEGNLITEVSPQEAQQAAIALMQTKGTSALSSYLARKGVGRVSLLDADGRRDFMAYCKAQQFEGAA